MLWNIERLRLWAENTARSSKGKSEGAHRRLLSSGILIGELDEILFAYTGDLISRSYKKAYLRRCVELCIRAVDSDIGSGSIDKAIQAHVKERLNTELWLATAGANVAKPLPRTQLLRLMDDTASKYRLRMTKLPHEKRG
jgi:hypothetical protein